MCYLRKCNQFVSVNPLAHTIISVKETTGNILGTWHFLLLLIHMINVSQTIIECMDSLVLHQTSVSRRGGIYASQKVSHEIHTNVPFLHTCEYQHIIHMRTICQMRVAPTMYTLMENRSDVSLRRDLAASSLGKQPHKKRRLSFKYSTVLSGILMIFSVESA